MRSMVRNRAKYGNKKTTIDGIRFDSKKEAARYLELKQLQEAGAISELHLQPRFELQKGFRKFGQTHRAIYYLADFIYLDKNGALIVEDVKGKQTAVYKLKKKLFEYRYSDLTIKEI